VKDGRHGLVSEMTLKQLKQLDIGSRIGPQWRGERIPTFEEILKLCQGKVGICLDLKDASVDKVVSMINKYGMARHFLWYADFDELERVAELCPDCILMPDPGLEENLPEVIERFKPSVVASVWPYYSRSFAEKCHRAGAIVIVDENDPSCWQNALEWNTDGIQTNWPAQLISLLEHPKR
jgi:glycerophosphoryl diester phosphodiesterase